MVRLWLASTEDGVSLVEVLVSMLLFGVVMSVVIAGLSSSLRRSAALAAQDRVMNQVSTALQALSSQAREADGVTVTAATSGLCGSTVATSGQCLLIHLPAVTSPTAASAYCVIWRVDSTDGLYYASWSTGSRPTNLLLRAAGIRPTAGMSPFAMTSGPTPPTGSTVGSEILTVNISRSTGSATAYNDVVTTTVPVPTADASC